MEELIAFIHQHVEYAPWLIFSALILAGFNLPVSEDALLFLSAYLAATHPDKLVPLFLGVYLGAYLSDLMVYATGRLLGPRLFRLRFFANARDKVAKISAYYDRYGVVTLIVGRFIPFGVRNALFLTAGIGRMGPRKFILADGLACTISCSFFFYLYYTFGEAVVAFVQRANIAIFSIAAIVIATLVFRARRKKNRASQTVMS